MYQILETGEILVFSQFRTAKITSIIKRPSYIQKNLYAVQTIDGNYIAFHPAKYTLYFKGLMSIYDIKFNYA